MTDVIIAGIGQTAVGEQWDTPLRSLGAQAIREAIKDSGNLRPQVLYAANVLAPSLSQQANMGTLLADHAGLTGIEAACFEAGGASGGEALRQGYLAVRSGWVDVALVAGVEKFTDMIGAEVEAGAATLLDSEYEAIAGMTPSIQAALLTRRYLHEFKLPGEALAGFPVTAHSNGAGNPNAMYHNALSLEGYQKTEKNPDPLNLFDIAPHADGAAAIVLTRADLLPKDYPHPRVRISASSAVNDTLAPHDRPDPLSFPAARQSVEIALEKAGIQREQVDLFELFDAFSIYAALSLEAAGYVERGQGWKLAEEGAIALTGQIPCSTMGGLKGRGNPLGATGIYQAVEATMQLRGQAGKNQIMDAKSGMIQCLAGPAALAVTHILERIQKE